MKRRTDIIMTACATAVVLGVIYGITRDYRTIKAVKKIRQKSAADIQRIWKAAAIVDAKMRRGDYAGRTVDDVLRDFEFYQQVFNYQEQEA